MNKTGIEFNSRIVRIVMNDGSRNNVIWNEGRLTQQGEVHTNMTQKPLEKQNEQAYKGMEPCANSITNSWKKNRPPCRIDEVEPSTSVSFQGVTYHLFLLFSSATAIRCLVVSYTSSFACIRILHGNAPRLSRFLHRKNGTP